MAAIHLYSFAKRVNSTKRPQISDTYLNLSGEFRTPCSVTQPVIVVEVPAGSDIFNDNYNYAYIPIWTRYYFVDDIVVVADHLAELHLTVDVLGTYRTLIGNSTQYVSRASAYKNGYITDNMYPVTNNNTTSNENLQLELDWWMIHPGKISDGYYVIGIVNPNVNAIGAVSYYVMDQTGFASFRSALMSNVSYSNMGFEQIEEPLYKSLFNPMQYIVSCVWFPLKPPTTVIGSFQIDFGFFHVPTVIDHMWYLADTTSYSQSNSLDTVNHPQVSEGAYYQHAPFTKRRLILQPFGEIELDCSKISDINHVLKLRTWIDYTTGDCVLRVVNTAEGDAVCGGAAAKLGVPIAMAQVSQNILGVLSGQAQMVAGGLQAIGGTIGLATAAAGINPMGVTGGRQLAQGVGTMANGLVNAAEAFAPKVTTAGTNGSLLATVVDPIYEVQFFRSTTPDYLRMGAPLCDTRLISSLDTNGGFIKCENAKMTTAVGAYVSEIVAVETYMNSGFYYE